jgi:hypothetical protein
VPVSVSVFVRGGITAVAAADNIRVGCGCNTWALARRPEALDQASQHTPPSSLFSRRLRRGAEAESIEVPEIDRLPRSCCRASTASASKAPNTIEVPLTARLLWTEFIASALVTVDRMAFAPPRFTSAAAGFSAAPSWWASHVLSCLVLSACDRDDLKVELAELCRELYPEMAKPPRPDIATTSRAGRRCCAAR